ncbi:MAG: hypothetical protein AAGA20_24525, partial [Planctomycetota bacterium]
MGAAAPDVVLDPKDGPDVDLRIAVEDDEVRFQIVTNLAFLDETTDAFREDPARLDPEEAPAAMEALLELFGEKNEVAIDGTVVGPQPPPPPGGDEVDAGGTGPRPPLIK